MGYIKDFFRKLQGSSPVDLTIAPNLLPVGDAAPSQPIVADECYLELFVESLRLAQARRFGTTFHGAVYAFVSIAREGEPNAELAAVSKPPKLAELDKGSLDNVITVRSDERRGGTSVRH